MYFVPYLARKPPVKLAKAQADPRCLIALLLYLLGLYRTWSETTMLNIATAHANMISLFIIRFWIVSQMFLNLNFKTPSNMQMLYSLVCVEDK